MKKNTPLKRELKQTHDGSYTLYIPEWNEHYHSKHGAVIEAQHVFIKYGLHHFSTYSKIHVLEMGMGTGLNALLAYFFSKQNHCSIEYTTIEKYPLGTEEWQKLSYHLQLPAEIQEEGKNILAQIHDAPWEHPCELTPTFKIHKIANDFREVSFPTNSFDLVFFDAFGMRVQPNLWSAKLFRNLYQFLKPQGLLTTYACNGPTKRALTEVGFDVKKQPGAPGKREMINAWKK